MSYNEEIQKIQQENLDLREFIFRCRMMLECNNTIDSHAAWQLAMKTNNHNLWYAITDKLNELAKLRQSISIKSTNNMKVK